MSNTTTTPTTTSSPNHLADLAIYRDATGEQQAALEADMGRETAAGLEKAEYLAALAEYETAGQYLAMVQGEEQPATQHPGSQAAADAAAKAELAKQSAEQAEEDARAATVATLQALVKVYKRGERAYAECLLESGRLARQYVSQRMGINHKERAAAVQQLSSSLGMWSSSVVDGPYVNRLMAAAAAADLLADGQELGEKQLKAVPYGHYRDAWCLLVERVKSDDGEDYVLLAGVEEMCRTHFKRAVTEAMSRESCIEWAKVCQREQLVQQTQAKALAEAAAKAARIKAEQEAAEARKQTQAAAAAQQATQKAAEAANAAAEAAAEEVLAAANTGDAEAAEAAKQESERLAAEATAKQAAAVKAREEAAAKAKADETARLEAELKAKQESRAKEEARVASERQATAEAKKAEQDRKAAEREGNRGQRQSKAKPAGATTQPSVESKPAGGNLLQSVRSATPKDAASMLADGIRGAQDPMALLYDVLAELLDTCPKGIKPDGVAAAMFQAMFDASIPAGPEAEALKAARLVMTRKQGAGPKTANVA